MKPEDLSALSFCLFFDLGRHHLIYDADVISQPVT